MAGSDTHIESPKPHHFSALEGVWRSRGYGKVLLIEGNEYTFYEETAISCLPTYWGPLEELSERYVDMRISPAGQAFSARRSTGVTRVSFRRLNGLPDTCVTLSKQEKQCPQLNFDVFWHTFAEHYALFDIKGVDWDRIYARHHTRISNDTPPEDLFATLASAITPLRDGHVRLSAPFGNCSAGASPALYRRLGKELEAADDPRGVPGYLAELREWLREVIHDDYLGGKSRQGGHRLMEWGQISDTAGYLNVRAMAGQCGKIGYPAQDMETIDGVMTRVFSELGHLPALVIDLRGNGGGYDGVALRLAGYIMDRKRLAFTKSARHAGRFTGQQQVYVRPAMAQPYAGRIFLLTSELTASAAEIFVLAVLQHPRLTLIGEPTQGILSDTLERHLPNGWHMTLSNELYRSFDDQIYEDTGIPPHIRIPFLGRKGREADCDPMLDRVLREI